MLTNRSGRNWIIAGKEIQIDRPNPILPNIEVFSYKRRIDPLEAVTALIDGHKVLIVDYFSSGLTILNTLRQYLLTQYSNQSFVEQRDYRSAFREFSQNLLVLVSNNKLNVRKAPKIGWLKILYPEIKEFVLPFPQVQGLNSSWQWYTKGLFIPVLNRKIHPFYGVYFPTRFEHLELFDSWLKQYSGEKKSAIDVGIGSGVLSFQLLKHGFSKVFGTDTNPNALVGVNSELTKNNLLLKVELSHGDLFANYEGKSNLIVFNPPWIPASYNPESLDRAIYYDSELFQRFFFEASQHLAPEGKLILLFSNLAQISKIEKNHPIEIELANGGRFEKELILKKKVRSASKYTTRNQSWRAEENVELWVLKLLSTK